MGEQATMSVGEVQQVEFRAMGSQILAAVQSDDPEVGLLLSQVPGWFAEWEQTLSRFNENSELSRLNRSAAGSADVAVGETLWKVLQVALYAAHSTGGLVTPTVLNALEAAGYLTGFDSMGREAGQVDSESARATGEVTTMGKSSSPEALASWREIKTDDASQSVWLPAGVRLDFGGIGKGWAADEAVARLAKYGPALVNAGGDIAVGGPLFGEAGWPVGVDAPLVPSVLHGMLALLLIRSGGVATSGRDYRRWQQDGQWRHHIIDPRTQMPANSDVVSATVVAPTACMAEIGAKVALLLGSSDGLAWLEERPSLAGMLVLESGEVVYSSRMNNYLWSNENGE